MYNINSAEAERIKRQVCIRRITNLLNHMNLKGEETEIYFEPLLWEVVRVLDISERVAKEYIQIALAANGLSRGDIQWYDKRFLKPTLNETQRCL